MKKEYILSLGLMLVGMLFCAHATMSYGVDKNSSIGALEYCGYVTAQFTECGSTTLYVPGGSCADFPDGDTTYYCNPVASAKSYNGKNEESYRVHYSDVKSCTGCSLTCTTINDDRKIWYGGPSGNREEECGIFAKYESTDTIPSCKGKSE